MRIASLLPSATEIVCAVGAREQLVGVSHECDHPSGVADLPVLTRPRRALPRRSSDVDRALRETLRDALAVYEVEVERLREVRPDVIVTQDLCDVCAVSLEDVRVALQKLARTDVKVVSLKPLRLDDVWNDVRRVGAAVGLAGRADTVAAELAQRCKNIGERAAAIGHRPTVLTIEWLDPVMIGGTWMPELVTLAGGTPLVTKPGQHAPTLTLDQLQMLDPDVVLIKPCGFPLERTEEEAALIRDKLPWNTWKASRGGRVFVADGSAYFNRPGPRLVESLEILAGCLHEEAFSDFATRHDSTVRRVGTDFSFRPR